MSAYKEFNSIAFNNGELLVQALAEMGFTAEIGQSLPLYGFQGDQRDQRAQIVIRRNQIGSLSNDLGFAWNGQAFIPIISEYDAQGRLNQRWREQLQATYSKLAIMRFLQEKKAAIGRIQSLEDGSIVFQATVVVRR